VKRESSLPVRTEQRTDAFRKPRRNVLDPVAPPLHGRDYVALRREVLDKSLD
jgi:hypothetical protein